MNPDSDDASKSVVIVGAGHGGGSVSAFLRQYGFAGKITLIGEEDIAPYHRPPLSKAWLKGDVGTDKLALKPGAFYLEQKVELRLGQRVESIDTNACSVALSNGEQVPYDDLILATGAYARTLPGKGKDYDNVITLRNFADAERLRGALAPGKRLVIIGGGYVGLECAATARALGAEVVVVEKAPRLLERVASATISSYLQPYHEKHGVSFALDANITAIEGDTSATAVRLADGRCFPCDLLLVGVGAAPATALAEAIGIACDDGILVNEDCRTSAPHIFALGDVARRPHPMYQHKLRLESIPSTTEQAKRVAAVITGREPVAAEAPWFWSDQYDLKLQIVGLHLAGSDLVIRGNPETGCFAVFHLHDGQVVTVEAINSPPEFFASKRWVGSGKTFVGARLADTSISLNELAA